VTSTTIVEGPFVKWVFFGTEPGPDPDGHASDAPALRLASSLLRAVRGRSRAMRGPFADNAKARRREGAKDPIRFADGLLGH
jgi:hypothetical protein